jgi:hypothetical protein
LFGLGEGGTHVVQKNEWLVICVGTLVVLAVLGLAGFVVAQLGSGEPAVIASVFSALAILLAAVPPIIKAIRGR